MTRTDIKSLDKEASLMIREERRLESMRMEEEINRMISSLRVKNAPPKGKNAKELQRDI